MLAQTFDDVVIGVDAKRVRECADWAGTDPEGAMLDAFSRALCVAGLAQGAVHTERDQTRSLALALDASRPGDLLVVLAEPWVAMPALNERRQAARA
jgi:hypothetical protein